MTYNSSLLILVLINYYKFLKEYPKRCFKSITNLYPKESIATYYIFEINSLAFNS